MPVNGVALLVAAGAGLRRGSPSPLALSWPTCAPYVVLLVSMISWSWVGLRASPPADHMLVANDLVVSEES